MNLLANEKDENFKISLLIFLQENVTYFVEEGKTYAKFSMKSI